MNQPEGYYSIKDVMADIRKSPAGAKVLDNMLNYAKSKRGDDQHLWARGYFCATVGNVTEEIIRNYIANQSTELKEDIFKIEE